MPSFKPKSDSELNSERLLPKAEYDFEVTKAEDKRFSTGSEGIALTVMLFVSDGTQRLCNDNLVFSEKAMFKVSNFAKATGLYEQYKAGRIDASDCEGRVGRCKVDIEPEGEFPAKNKITTYVVPKEARKPEQKQAVKVTPAPQAEPADDDSSDVPF
jgi:hypothetical protein